MSIIDKLLEEYNLNKIAQETEINETTANKLADDIFDELFDEEIKQLMSVSITND